MSKAQKIMCFSQFENVKMWKYLNKVAIFSVWEETHQTKRPSWRKVLSCFVWQTAKKR